MNGGGDKKNIIIGDILREDFSFRVPDRKKTQKKRKPNKEIQIKGPKEKVKSLRKRNILLRIRDLQEKNYKDLLDTKTKLSDKAAAAVANNDDATLFNSSFDESVKYMQALSEKIETSKIHPNHTLRSYSSSSSTPLSNESWVYTNTPMECSQTLTPSTAHPPIHLAEPKWGCMKNGKLPTYRNWKQNTQKSPVLISPPVTSSHIPSLGQIPLNQPIMSLPAPTIPTPIPIKMPTQMQSSILPNIPVSQGGDNSKEELLAIKQKMEQMKKQPKKMHYPKQRKTVRRTFKVGKSKNKPLVGVLISNKTMRSNITTKKQLLNQTSMDEIKRYLIKNGFIRVGSTSPNDVLRKMYETAMMMCGEIHNHNPDNLLYNYLQGKA